MGGKEEETAHCERVSALTGMYRSNTYLSLAVQHLTTYQVHVQVHWYHPVKLTT